MKKLSAVFFCLSILSGCISSGPVNTATPTTSDLLFRYNDLNAHLEQRRLVLATLEVKLSDLDTELLMKIGEIRKAKTSLQNVEAASASSAADLAELRSEIADLEMEADAAFQRVSDAEMRREELSGKYVRDSSGVLVDREELQNLSLEVDQLEGEVTGLETAVERTVTIRVNSVLRSEKGIRN